MKMRQTLSTALLLCLGLTSYAQGVDDLVIEDGKVQISTAADLRNFAIAVNGGDNSLDAVLLTDIDYAEFEKIGNTTTKFARRS